MAEFSFRNVLSKDQWLTNHRLIYIIDRLMDIKALTKEMHEFVNSQGWYDENSPRPQNLRNLAISLSLEASEVLEHFQWSDYQVEEKELADELADVALYLIQIASIAGIDLEEAILHKLDRNYNRSWEG